MTGQTGSISYPGGSVSLTGSSVSLTGSSVSLTSSGRSWPPRWGLGRLIWRVRGLAAARTRRSVWVNARPISGLEGSVFFLFFFSIIILQYCKDIHNSICIMR